MPLLPVPPSLTGSEPGSFAEDTIKRRLPEIARRVIAENNFAEPVNERLESLANDLPNGTIRLLKDEKASDWLDWTKAIQPYLGKTWLALPLFTAEMYFYRRILEAIGYFAAGPGYGMDPYRLQKQLGLEQARAALEETFPQGLAPVETQLQRLVHLSLWANQADLSLWPVHGKGGGRAGGEAGEGHLMVDQASEAVGYLESKQGGRVDLLLDNSGTELAFDLLLADALLARGFDVRLQVKPHPCFVSDTLAGDVMEILDWLGAAAPTWAKPAAGRLLQAEKDGRLLVATHFYWASPYPAWEMPPDLWADLASSTLLISKGDVNYRRWIGDARWNLDTHLDAIINPPAPLLLLRISKSDVAAGIPLEKVGEAARRDPAWQLDGQWGMIEFVK